MKEIYKHIGKNGYFEEHPTQVLRHIGVHYWLARNNYNYGLVALIGGWHTIDELKKSYGEMPLKKFLKIWKKIPELHETSLGAASVVPGISPGLYRGRYGG
jgi:hypothetical protein